MSASAPRNEILGQIGPIFASMLGLACGVATLGLPYTIGAFVKPLQAEFGWSLTQIMLVQPIVAAAVVKMAAVTGWLVDRYGARRLILLSQLGFGLGLMAIGAFTRSLLAFYVLYYVMALAAGGTLAITFTKLLSARFDRQRGLALGLALAGTGICSLVFQPATAWVVEATNWRTGYFFIGLLPICLALPAAYIWLHDANAREAAPSSPSAVAAPPDGIALREALRGWRFIALFVVFFLFSGAVTCVLNNFVPILMEKGYDPVRAAAIAGTFGLAIIVGRIGIGALIDRWWAPLVGFCFFVPSAIGMVLLAGPPLPTFVMIGCIVLAGLAAGAEVDLMAYLVSRYFGLRDFGKIYAGIYIGFALGPGVLVPLFARSRDLTGGFAIGLYGVAATMLLSAIVLLTLGPYVRFRHPEAAAAR